MIVCGLHGVGLLIVEELSLSGVPAVVVDDEPDAAGPDAARLGCAAPRRQLAGADLLTRAGPGWRGRRHLRA